MNKEITLYTLENENLKLGILDLGATIRYLKVKTKKGDFKDVILGYKDLDVYRTNPTFFGAIIGRNSNRIKDGSFEIDGVTYQMDKNENGNNLHSGYDFFCNRFYTLEAQDEKSLMFSLSSSDGDQGFPGNMKFCVRYTLCDNNVLIEYTAVSDKNTVYNPTNHSYFNLGYNNDVYDHELFLNSSKVIEVDEELIPTGNTLDVTGTSFDFRERRILGEVLSPVKDNLAQTQGIDHNFVFDSNDDKKCNASIYCKETGIRMNIYTDYPAIQIYTGNLIEEIDGLNDTVYHKHSGMCMETGFVPDSINSDVFEKPVLNKDEEESRTVRFEFVTDEA